MLISTSSCPFCLSGNNSPCFATYDDGYHCFTCGKTKRGGSDFSAYLPKNTRDTKFYLPEHTTNPSQFSPEVLKWLYSKYVFPPTIRKYRILYIPESGMVGLPVFNDEGELVFCQLRKNNPKGFITKGSKMNTFIAGKGTSKTLVIVEDYISAVRVGEYTDTLCLFGTTINYSIIDEIIKNYDNFVIWLDGDQAGIKASAVVEEMLVNKLMKQSIRYAYSCTETKNVGVLNTKLDPKCYTDAEIKNFVGDLV